MTPLKIYVLTLILALGLRESSAARPFVGKKFHVHIIDFMQPSLVIHCKSKDNDLGQQQLEFNQEFVWGFYINFWGTTLFWCNFWWGSNHGSYDVFVSHRDYWKCGYGRHCYWHVQETGLYFMNHDSGQYDLKYPWPK